jgi:ubiquinone/menaquinone biosynthesis C-methylase UbiE
MGTIWKCAQLNWRVFTLGIRGRWLSLPDIERGYDQVAQTYEQEWLCHLHKVTDDLLRHLPPPPDKGGILDLGCGTGYTTGFLARQYPDSPITAIDVSKGMLAIARKNIPEMNVMFEYGDMLAYLRKQRDASYPLILSAWALGYSNPAAVIRESSRLLKTGGHFALVVNRLDTLGPVFRIFQQCMHRFPECVQKALWPRFPKSFTEIASHFAKTELHTVWHDENRILLNLPESEKPLDWLLKTGVLAGFDQVLPLQANREINQYFNEQLQENQEPIAHHYIAAIAKKHG